MEINNHEFDQKFNQEIENQLFKTKSLKEKSLPLKEKPISIKQNDNLLKEKLILVEENKG